MTIGLERIELELITGDLRLGSSCNLHSHCMETPHLERSSGATKSTVSPYSKRITSAESAATGPYTFRTACGLSPESPVAPLKRL